MVGTATGGPGRARRQYLGCWSGKKEAAAVRSGYKKARSCRSGSSGGLLPVPLLDAVLNTSRSRNHRQVVSVTVSPPTALLPFAFRFPREKKSAAPNFDPESRGAWVTANKLIFHTQNFQSSSFSPFSLGNRCLLERKDLV